MTIRRLPTLATLSIACLALLAGCAGAGTTRAGPATDVAMCAKCRVVWLAPLNPSDANVPTYTADGKVHVCPECHSAVVSLFRSGRFEHTCDACGDALIHCRSHVP